MSCSRYKDHLWFAIVPLAALAAFGAIWVLRDRGRDGAAFFCSAAMLAMLLVSASVGLFPNLLISTTDPAYNMTVTNAASSSETLTVMLVVAVIGLPFVLLYTAGVQYLFRERSNCPPIATERRNLVERRLWRSHSRARLVSNAGIATAAAAAGRVDRAGGGAQSRDRSGLPRWCRSCDSKGAP